MTAGKPIMIAGRCVNTTHARYDQADTNPAMYYSINPSAVQYKPGR